MIDQLNKLIADAQFDISFQEREIIKRKLNLEVSPDCTWEQGMLKTSQEKDEQAKHRLARLTEKLAEVQTPEANEVNRLEVIDNTGRVLVKYGVNVKLDYQDNGQTLKLFLS